MTIIEAAQYLNLNPEVLRRLCREGRGPQHTRGGAGKGRYEFTQEDLDTWLASRGRDDIETRQRRFLEIAFEKWRREALPEIVDRCVARLERKTFGE